ncbi:MAG: hypothetical protein HYZ10_01455 [Ignavibacteriales bacterium]|nr:hypothetical protein [Ignavibacteriales bacterium]
MKFIKTSLVKKYLVSTIVFSIITILLSIFPSWIVDDAFIIFRYANNLAEHGDLTYNIGHDLVEGYTGIFLPLLMFIGFKFHLEPVLFTHAINIACLYSSVLAVWLILRKLKINSKVSLSILLLFVLSPFNYTHALSGLETTLYMTSVLVSFYLTISALDNPKYFWLLSFSFLIVSITRPEGIVVSAFLFLLSCFHYKASWISLKRILIPFLLTYLLPGLIYFLWRWNYYGLLFPNTFYVKAFQKSSYLNKSKDLYQYIRSYLLIPFLISTLFYSLKRYTKKNNYKVRGNKSVVITIVSLLIFMHAFYYSTNLEMHYSFRFYYPYYPLILIAFSFMSDNALNLLKWNKGERFISGTITSSVIILVVLQLYLYSENFGKEIHFAKTYMQTLDDEHFNLARFINNLFPKAKKLAVCSDAGLIPYYTNMTTLDFRGLNDKYLAVNKNKGLLKTKYFFDFDPDIICITSYSKDKLINDEVDTTIIENPHFKKYFLKRVFTTKAKTNSSLYFFAKSELINK